jgi:hypothetical protein
MTLPGSNPPPPTTTDDEFAAHWAALRRRRRIRWIGFFGWAPIAFALVELMEALFGHDFAGRYFLVIVAPLLLVAMGAMIYGSSSKCPGCGLLFESRSLVQGLFVYRNPFTRHCLNCRLELGAPASVAGSSSSDLPGP